MAAIYGEKDHILRAGIDNDGDGRIEVAVGAFEEKIKDEVGHYPSDVKDQTLLSVYITNAIFDGYCQLASQRGIISKQKAREISDNYLDSILNGDELRLIIWLDYSTNR